MLAQASERVSTLLFGGEDYSAQMGVTRTKRGEELLYARSAITHAAHASGLEALDTVFTDLVDDASLLEETQRVRQLGFTGKLLIHPRQIDVVHKAFAPDSGEIRWAEEIIRAFEAVPGSGVAVAGGQMVDQPVVLQARRILARRDRGQAEPSGAN
jgi:citrate lyase subunit beta/citryl-CoA lyase